MYEHAENKKPINILSWKNQADFGTDVKRFETDLEKNCELRIAFQWLGNFMDLEMGFELPRKQEKLSEEYSTSETWTCHLANSTN